jgi:hypothetical protein
VWFESRNAGDAADNLRVLDGATLNETFYDENGGVAWSAA